MGETSSSYVTGDGDGYELQMGRWSRRLAGPFLDFVGLADGERLLDVGCGTGNLTSAALARDGVREIVGVDFSPAYVEDARRRCPDPRASFRVGDATGLAFEDRSFDRVLSTRFGHAAARLVAEGKFGRMVALQGNRI